MKKLFCAVGIACSITVSAQLIDKNDVIISAGGGSGLNKYQFTDVTNNVVNPRDKSGAWVFPFQIEYGFNRWLGAGLNFTGKNYIEGEVTDDLNNKYEFKLDGPGQTFGFGLFYRI